MRVSPIDSEAMAKELNHNKWKRDSSNKCESYLINKGKMYIPMHVKGDLYRVSLSGFELARDQSCFRY